MSKSRKHKLAREARLAEKRAEVNSALARRGLEAEDAYIPVLTDNAGACIVCSNCGMYLSFTTRVKDSAQNVWSKALLEEGWSGDYMNGTARCNICAVMPDAQRSEATRVPGFYLTRAAFLAAKAAVENVGESHA